MGRRGKSLKMRLDILPEMLPTDRDITGAEVGVKEGYLSEALLRKLPCLTLHLVDRWATVDPDSQYAKSGDRVPRLSQAQFDEIYNGCVERCAFAGDRAVYHVGDSADMAADVPDGSLDFVFIDADHSYEGCLQDLRAWWPKVKPGGLFAGHDYKDAERARHDGKGVAQAVDDFLGHRPELTGDLIWYVRRDYGDYRDLFRGKRVAVLGSAPTVQRHTDKALERYDTVVRMNGGAIAGRTDVLYGGREMPINYKTRPEALEGVQHLVARCKGSKKRWRQYRFGGAGMPMSILDAGVYDSVNNKLRAAHEDLKNTCPMSSASTGLLALADVLRSQPAEVLVDGFTFYRKLDALDVPVGSPHTMLLKRRAYMDGYKVSSKVIRHDWDAEALCMARLVHKRGDVTLVSELKQILATYSDKVERPRPAAATPQGRDYVVTVATAECSDGVNRMLRSLRRVGYGGRVLVFCPDTNEPPALEDGNVEIIQTVGWWRHYEGAFNGAKNNNVPAMAKPDVFLDKRYRDGDRILYVDGSDVLFFEHPRELFKTCAAPVSACPAAKKLIKPRAKIACDFLHSLDLPSHVRHNNGVILARVCPEMRAMMWLWRSLLYFGVTHNAWTIGGKMGRPMIGDQPAFNATLAIMKDSGVFESGVIPAAWNVRGRKDAAVCHVDNGTVLSRRGERVCILHASGGCEVPQSVRRLIAT